MPVQDVFPLPDVVHVLPILFLNPGPEQSCLGDGRHPFALQSLRPFHTAYYSLHTVHTPYIDTQYIVHTTKLCHSRPPDCIKMMIAHLKNAFIMPGTRTKRNWRKRRRSLMAGPRLPC